VIDFAAGQSWHRSLSAAESGLTQDVVDSLTPTNAQGVQIGDRLYMTGGYGFDAAQGGFRTFDRLTSFDLPSLVDWVKQDAADVTDTFRQLQNPAFRVTGGAMTHANGRTHLIFGQEFDGGYDPISSGIYTEQIRSFSIVDDGQDLAVDDIQYGDVVEEYHRRDLSVVPVVRADGQGNLERAWTALAGVFTLGDRAWTVPVEITADGEPSMADQFAEDTFKQGMNIYQTANLGMFSERTGEMHTLLFGGITYQYYDRDAGVFINDNLFPFTNQSTAVVVDAEGNYAQYLLDEEFPVIADENGKRLRFGANGEFFPVPGVARFDNGVLMLDELRGETTLGHIFGGLMADAGNFGKTAGSNFVFEVVLTPVPEPSSLVLVALAVLAATCVVARRFRRRAG
jgi:hypothetical protein